MRRLPALPVSLGLCSRLRALPGTVICALSYMMMVPLLILAHFSGGRRNFYPIVNPLDAGPLVRHRHIGRCFTFSNLQIMPLPMGGGGLRSQAADPINGDRVTPSHPISAHRHSHQQCLEEENRQAGESGKGSVTAVASPSHLWGEPVSPTAMRVSSPLPAPRHGACSLPCEEGGRSVLLADASQDPRIRLAHFFFDAPLCEWQHHSVLPICECGMS
jgi:hypothetical protein